MLKVVKNGLKIAPLCLALVFLSGCSSYMIMEPKGIPVKNFKPTPEELAQAEQVRQQQDREVEALAAVTGNSVFTESHGMPEYLVGPGDVLQITYWEGSKPLVYTTEVRSDGKISYSFLDNVPVSGRTLTEIYAILQEGLKQYIRNPRFEITVKEYKSKSALIFGQINKLPQGTSGPGKYALKGKTSVLDLLVMAGGPITGKGGGISGSGGAVVVMGGDDQSNADLRKVELLRKGKRYTLNLYDAMYKGDLTQNVLIDNGDIVNVPELPMFGERVYVLGEVATQGIYRLKDASDLLSSLSIAGGPTRLAIKSDIKIIRGYKDGKASPIILSASYDDITKQGDISQNVPLKNGDIVWVPRILIGDMNEFIVNTIPLLDYLLTPAKYREAYGSTDAMRLK
jgi:protein involved in polysaccharide export with SLBB domain